MAKEIERKFLVKDISFISEELPHHRIFQAYLSDRPDATVRLRVSDSKAWLTVKSKNHGSERDEWEYEIPESDAREMLVRCGCHGVIDKTRYRDGRWEIDVFHGCHDGLVIAEIELKNENEQVTLPYYIGREVTGDPRYYNSCLATTDTIPPTE